jgi:CO/xanthine dehydrogenase Mo-binding subunit
MIGISTKKMVDRLAELVAGEFGHDLSDVIVEPGGFRTPNGRVHSVAEAASLATSELVEVLRYTPKSEDVVDTFEAMAAEVTVDGETGQIQIDRVVSSLEVGRIINPLMHRGQIDGGAIQGVGYALMEGLTFDEGGRVTTSNLHEYKLPTFADIPPFESLLLPPEPALGITPIGEGPNCGMAAVIVTAVMDAVGHPVTIPIRPEDLVADE